MSDQNKVIFETTDPEGRSIGMNKNSWDHITTGHPEITSTEEIRLTIKKPNVIIQNSTRSSVSYSKTGRTVPYVNVIAKMDDTYTKGTVKTAYLSNKMPKGRAIWIRRSSSS